MGFKTSQVCDLLNEPYHRLIELLRARKIPRPSKDASGDYWWTEQDVERAKQALAANRQRKESVPA